MIAAVMAEAKEKMDKSVEAAKDDFSNVRTGRGEPRAVPEDPRRLLRQRRRRSRSSPACSTLEPARYS